MYDDEVEEIEEGNLEQISVTLKVETLAYIDKRRGEIVKRSPYIRKFIEDYIHLAPNYATLDKRVKATVDIEEGHS